MHQNGKGKALTACYEYQCHNDSGAIYWKQCNNTNEITRVCENDQCIEVKPENDGEKYIVEIEGSG